MRCGAPRQASWHDLAPDIFEMADAHSGAAGEERAAAAALINPEVTVSILSGPACTLLPSAPSARLAVHHLKTPRIRFQHVRAALAVKLHH